MKKFTRKHYNKKLVALGLSAFMGIGLVSTGFAAWVMSKNAGAETEGNVTIATITDAAANIELLAPAEYDAQNKIWSLNDNFSFDSVYTDKEGRLRSDKTSDDEDEDLLITISGKLSASEGVKYDLSAKVTLPAGIAAALEQGYIAWAPELVQENIDYSQGANVNVSASGEFTIEIKFVWGEKFGGLNPCFYYDTEGKGKEIDDAKMSEELDLFHSVISAGLNETPAEGNIKNSYTGKFGVILTASPAEVTP